MDRTVQELEGVQFHTPVAYGSCFLHDARRKLAAESMPSVLRTHVQTLHFAGALPQISQGDASRDAVAAPDPMQSSD